MQINSAIYTLLFLLLATQPNPGAYPVAAKAFQGAGLLLGLLLLLGDRERTKRLSVDLWDVLIVALGLILALITQRPAFVFFTASLAIAKQVILLRPTSIPLGPIIVVLTISAIATMRETQHEGRLALMIGDPNFSAVICLIFLVAVLCGKAAPSSRLLLMFVPAVLIALTVSRAGVLCGLLSIAVLWIPKLRTSRRAASTAFFCLFTLSIIGPALAGLAIQGGYLFSELQGSGSRYFTLEDSSNLSRILGYLTAVDHLRQTDVLLLGDPDYTDKIPQFVPLPHNWVLGGAINYGAIVVGGAGLYLLSWRSLLRDGAAITLFGIYMLAAGMLNVSVLTGLFIVCLSAALSMRERRANDRRFDVDLLGRVHVRAPS